LKQNIYILTIIIGLLSCNNHPKGVDEMANSNTDTTLTDNSTIKSNETLQSEEQKDTSNILYSEQQFNDTSRDSVIYFYDTHFTDLGSALKEISGSKFKEYNKTTTALDENAFLKRKGLILEHDCEEICVAYLKDIKDGIKLLLPSDYDQGIIGLIISPSCNQFIVYSSYDGPDYMNFYSHRAEVFVFTIAQGQGIQIIKPTFKFYSKDWSIEEVIWANDNEIAFKTYQESRSLANQDNLNYKYFKTKITK
jgi:hypothetical protein